MMTFSKRVFLIFLSAFVVVALFSITASAADYSKKYDIRIGDAFHYIKVQNAETLVSYSPTYSVLSDSLDPGLYNLGFIDKYTYNTTSYFRQGTAYIFGEFTGSELANSTTLLSDFSYFTVSLYCCISTTDYVDNSIVNVVLNSPVTAAYGSVDIYDSTVEYVTYDGQRVGVYTFGFDLNDLSGIPGDMTVSGMFANNELLIYPKTVSSATVPVSIYLSELHLKLYTQADMITNGFDNVTDAINQSNQEVIAEIDALKDMLTVPSIPHPPNTDVGEFNDKVNQEEELMNDINNTLPEFDKTIFDNRLPDLTSAYDFLGNLTTRVIDMSFSGLLYWVLAFGIAVTIIGRAVT